MNLARGLSALNQKVRALHVARTLVFAAFALMRTHG